MNQVEEEESIYRALEEEAIDVDCLLVEPRSDQVSVSSVWSFEEDNLGKCLKVEDVPYESGVRDSNINVEVVDTTKLNALESFPHDDGVENLIAASDVSACDDYLLDIGYAENGACLDYGSVGSDNLQSQIRGFSGDDKGSFGISGKSRGSACPNDFLVKTCDLHGGFDCSCVFGKSSAFTTASLESKDVNMFQETPNSITCGQNEVKRCFEANKPEVAQLAQDVGVGVVANKRLRKPTKRYIDESSNLTLKNCKKRREISSPKVKVLGVRRAKHHRHRHQTEPKAKTESTEISFDKAIQVPFVSQGTTGPKDDSPTVMEHCIEKYSSGSEEEIMRSMGSGNQRKLHRLWSVSEVKKLVDGVAHFGVGKWTHIKRLLFSSSVHRTPVDLKDKWRNLLKASCALNDGNKIEDEQKRSQAWRPLPKWILCRVRELASVYPYPREAANSKISKSKFPLGPAAAIKGNQVPVL